MAVDANNGIVNIRDILHDPFNQIPELRWYCPSDGFRDIDNSRPSSDSRFNDFIKKR